MSKRYYVNWCLWIGLMSGIYVLLYSASPLFQYGIMPASFVALPIYFLAGANPREFLEYASSAVAGVAWGCLYLFLLDYLTGMGMFLLLAQFIVVGVVTAVLCAFHFIVTPRVVFSKIPMMFGAIASSFFGDVLATPERILPLMVTLILGLVLAIACNTGTRLLTEDGHWKFRQEKN